MQDRNGQPAPRRKHLLTAEELASHAGAGPQDLVQGRRHGNGLRVHRTYIMIVSVLALVAVGVASAMASVRM
ncbi:MAG: hypothetical protein L0H31_01285 [Nocardioidaceae bacterium]|nr:hypothetical protein [Nocardioidaceae bacterium]